MRTICANTKQTQAFFDVRKGFANKIKSLLTVGLLYFGSYTAAWATDYYISNQGDDTNAGTSASVPWKTLAHVSGKVSVLKPGDKILLQRGSVFYEALALNRLAGNASSPVTIGAYGSGADPIISGAVRVSGWQRIEGNIWKASCPECPSDPAAVLMNDELLPIGRYPNIDAPNRGYMIIDQSHDYHDNKIIIDNELPSSFPDNYWQGAEVVARTRRWLLDKAKIASHTGHTINLGNRLTYGVHEDYGYFIQSHYKTLDVDKEWYFDNATQELYIVLENVDPNNQRIEVPKLETVLEISSSSYITIQHITFEKSSIATVKITNSPHCKFQNNHVVNAGRDGLYIKNSSHAEISGNKIEHSLNTGFMFLTSSNAKIHDNEIINSATIPGMGASGNGEQSGVYLTGSNNIFEYNKVIHSGYNGINFGSGPWEIRYNLVDGYCMSKDDGAGIYTYGNKVGNTVSYNIILNGIGSPEGTPHQNARADRGLYADGGSSKIVYDHNTISNSGEGMLIHVSNTITLTNNTFLGSVSHALRINQSTDNGTEHPDLRKLLIEDNTFISSQDQDALYKIMSYRGDVETFGTIGNNLLCQPLQSFSPAASYIMEMEQNPDYPSYGIDRRYHTFQDLANCAYASTDQESPLAYDRYTIIDTLSSNLLNNSAIDYQLYEVASWNKETNDKTKFNAWKTADGGIDGSSLKASFTSATASDYGRVVHKNVQFDEGAYYALSFDIKGSNHSQIILRAVTRYGEDLHGLRTFMLKPGTVHHQFIFKAKTTTNKGRIYFDLTADNDMVWFDNLEMYKVNVQEIPEAQVVRLEYNASKSAKELTIDGGYHTVEGNAISGKISLAPYESLVLIKDLNYEEPEGDTAPPPTQIVKEGFPWDEQFDLDDKTALDQGTTGWRMDTTQAGAKDFYGVREQKLYFTISDKPVFWYSNKIDIAGKGMVGISLDIKEKGGMETDNHARDFLYAYYKVDGGALYPIHLQEGNLSADDTWYRFTVDSISGNFLEVIITGKTTAYQENFYVDNVLVNTNEYISEHKIKALPNPPEDQDNAENPEEQPVEEDSTDIGEDGAIVGGDDKEEKEEIENRNGSTIRIYAAGRSGEETMQLLIDEKPVTSWKNIIGNAQARKLVQYVYVHDSDISNPERIRVAFAGSDNDTSELLVDKIILDGVIYETEAASTFSTGTNKNGSCDPGYKEDERLHCPGYFQYAPRESIVMGLGDEVAADKFSLTAYPNPASQNITVKIGGSKNDKVSLELIDITGRTLYSIRQLSVHHAHTINVSRFRAGVYLLRAKSTASDTHTIRIIKK